jgi:hypothetical protein
MAAVKLEIHICDQRRGYMAEFASPAQAIDFIERRLPSSDKYELNRKLYPYGNHDFTELEESPLVPFGPLTQDDLRLLELLYPHCEHGLSADLCYGPNHYPTADQEREMGW